MLSFLIDMNMPIEWVPWLQEKGYSAIRWSSIGDVRADDEELMQWALGNHYIVLTQDLDFGTLLALTRAQGPSVILMRGKESTPESSGHHLLQVIETTRAVLEQGALVVVDEYRVRVRVLPLSP